jgi:hypothetical protein
MWNHILKRRYTHTCHGICPLRADCVQVGALHRPRILQNLIFCVQPLSTRPIDHNSGRKLMRGSQGYRDWVPSGKSKLKGELLSFWYRYDAGEECDLPDTSASHELGPFASKVPKEEVTWAHAPIRPSLRYLDILCAPYRQRESGVRDKPLLRPPSLQLHCKPTNLSILSFLAPD